MLSLYRPLGELFRDDFFTRTWDPMMGLALPREGQAFEPAVDVVEKEGEYLVQAELPGMKPEEMEVEVKDGVLTLRGERTQEKEETKDGYRRTERRYGRFERSFTLPKGTDPDAVEAQVQSGVLTIHVPKPAPVKAPEARKVEVKPEGLLDKAKKVFAKAAETPVATQ